jgi:hypothetical protein
MVNKPRKYDPLQISPALTRAGYSCEIAKEYLAGGKTPPTGCSGNEAALYSLASALQDIAKHLMDEKAEAMRAKGEKSP